MVSAYASGALVKCRKVGAAELEINLKKSIFRRRKKVVLKSAGPGYKKVGTQKLFGKTYNRCVKAGYEMDGITFRRIRRTM